MKAGERMNIVIGPYRVQRRTEYSKYQLYNSSTDENITKGNEDILEKIIKDYELQTRFPERYFKIEDGQLMKVMETPDVKELDFLFIPEGITQINRFAVANGTFMEVCLPESLLEIKDAAFEGCQNLKNLILPDSLFKIGENAFKNCNKMETLKLPSNLYYINKWCFYNCKSLKKLVLPDKIFSIRHEAFAHCTSLKSVVFNKNLEMICNGAFLNCRNLKKIDLPNSVTAIGEYCFADCFKLKEVNLSEKILNICNNAFSNCWELENIRLPSNLAIIGNEAFKQCRKLSNLTLPDTVHSLGFRVFIRTAMESINLPKGLKMVGLPVFSKNDIHTLKINGNVARFGDRTEGKEGDAKLVNLFNSDILTNTSINKLEIGHDVIKIDAKTFKFSGEQITEIEYCGSKSEFEIFKKNNKQLFDLFTNLEKVTIKDDIEKSSIREVER